MCGNNSLIWLILLVLIFCNCSGDQDNNEFNNFFKLSSSDPLFSGVFQGR